LKAEILRRLAELEADQGMTLLFACESGSRAWGFPSPDSDYDVRFVYVKPLPYHLSLGSKDDTLNIMLPGDLDLSGWELGKVLRLFAKSNIPLFEWIQSPLIYLRNEAFHQQLLDLLPQFFNPIAGIHHYLNMAKSSLGAASSLHAISVKKALYALRTSACAAWIEHFQTMPPTDFHLILQETRLISTARRAAIERLIDQKRSMEEAFLVDLPETLIRWLQEIQDKVAMPEKPDKAKTHQRMDALNQVFYHWVLKASKPLSLP